MGIVGLEVQFSPVTMCKSVRQTCQSSLPLSSIVGHDSQRMQKKKEYIMPGEAEAVEASSKCLGSYYEVLAIISAMTDPSPFCLQIPVDQEVFVGVQ